MESPYPPLRLVEPDEQVLKSLNALSGNPHFEAIKEWLRDSLSQNTTYLVVATPDEVPHWQSACSVVKYLIYYAENAGELLRARH